MPKTRKYGARRPTQRRRPGYKRTSYKTKRRAYGRIGRLPRGPASTPFPPVMYKCLTYADDTYRLVQTVTDVPVYYEYRGNSCFDPDLTGIGDQPRYFDTLCGAQSGSAPYGNYNVLASKLVIDIYQDPAATSQAGTVFIQPVRGATLGVGNATDMADVVELPNIKRREVGLNTSSRPLRLSAYMKTKSIFGDTNGTDVGSYQGSFSSNPALQWKWVIGALNIIPTGIFSCYIRAYLKLYVQFSLLNRVVQS